jgi:glycerol-3-phosphate dehydrogenase (NAD(P)+)
VSDSLPKSPIIAILGAGSWGSTLAWLLASNGRQVHLWSHDPLKVQTLKETRSVEKPLAVTIPSSVVINADLRSCIEPATVILFACSAQSMRSVAEQVREILTPGNMIGKPQAVAAADVALSGSSGSSASRTENVGPLRADAHTKKILVSAAKGIELKTFLRMSQVLAELLPGYDVCALSGPNLAAEVLRGLPTASVIACADIESARKAQEQLNVPSFRIYTNDDVTGVELGGAFKNIIGIAAGVVDGLDLGTNAKAALMTRGLAEMTRLSIALGGKPATLAGLSGMGDLVATCYSVLSRNYRLGFQLAKGETLDMARKELGAVAEGVTTAQAVCELSQRLGIELPIAEQVDRTLRGSSTPVKAIMTLMTRPLASE